jgi:hypothetical protein
MKGMFQVLGLSLVLTGCASFSGIEHTKNISKIRYGMTESKVLSILGTPDSVVHQSVSQDQWIYEFKKQDLHGKNMFFTFENGKLVKSGKLTGREIAAANENRVPGICTKRVHPEVQLQSLCIK